MALQTLAAEDNRAPATSFQRRFGEIRRFGGGSLQRERPWANPANVSEWLWYRGLITRGFVEMPEGMVECVAIPSDLLPFLPLASTQKALPLPPPAPPPERVYAGGDAFLEDLATLLIYVHNEQIWLNPRGGWRPRDVQALVRQWQTLPEDPPHPLAPGSRGALLFRCAARAGLLDVRGRRQRLHGENVRFWLEQDRFGQERALFMAWRDDVGWNDLCLTPGLICEAGNWRNDPLRTRADVLSYLGQIEAGNWYGLEDFIGAMQAHAPDFQRPDGNYDAWYLRDETGLYLRGFEHWRAVEGRLLRYLWRGPLFWLGLIALDEARERWSLTSRGAAFLTDASARPPEPSPPALLVSEDFRVLLPTGFRPSDRFRVARFAEWEASWPGYRYRITQRQLRRATAMGITPDQIIDFLIRASDDRLPASVRRSLSAFQP